MEIELHCPRCLTRFAAPPQATPDEVRARMVAEGCWFGLAEAGTFAGMIFARVARQGDVLCGECGGPASFDEAIMGALAPGAEGIVPG